MAASNEDRERLEALLALMPDAALRALRKAADAMALQPPQSQMRRASIEWDSGDWECDVTYRPAKAKGRQNREYNGNQ